MVTRRKTKACPRCGKPLSISVGKPPQWTHIYSVAAFFSDRNFDICDYNERVVEGK